MDTKEITDLFLAGKITNVVYNIALEYLGFGGAEGALRVSVEPIEDGLKLAFPLAVTSSSVERLAARLYNSGEFTVGREYVSHEMLLHNGAVPGYACDRWARGFLVPAELSTVMNAWSELTKAAPGPTTCPHCGHTL